MYVGDYTEICDTADNVVFGEFCIGERRGGLIANG